MNLSSQSPKSDLQEDFETMIGVNNVCMVPTDTLI